MAVLVDEWVQAFEIVVIYFFAGLHPSMQLVRVGASPKEGVPWFKQSRGLMGLEELLDGGLRILSFDPFAFPDGTDQVTMLSQQVVFFVSKPEHVIHSPSGGSKCQ